MGDSAGNTGFLTSCQPRAAVGLNTLASLADRCRVRKHPRADDPTTAQCLVERPLVGEGNPQLVEIVEFDKSPARILGCAGLKTDRAGPVVDLVPLGREDFAVDSPPRAVSERDQTAKMWREVAAHNDELIALEEPLSHVALLQHRDMRLLEERSRPAGNARVNMRFRAANSLLIVALAAPAAWRSAA